MIRFRAWDKFDKEMLEVHGINFDAQGIWTREMIDDESDGNFVFLDEVELMQSTGIKDKNDIEIFEGDIVKNVTGELGYIGFLKQEMGYVIVYKNRDRRLGHRNGIEDFHLETIGNIYEHPHLIEE